MNIKLSLKDMMSQLIMLSLVMFVLPMFVMLGGLFEVCLIYCLYNSSLYLLDYCQAQPQFQLSRAELALFLIPPAARPPGRTSSEIAL